MEQDTMVDRASWVLTAVGAINWGLVGLAKLDLVKAVFGRDTFATRLVYGLVGVAGAWSIYHLISVTTRAPQLVRR